MKYKKLTPSQLNIMKTLWDKKEPMIASDYVQLDPSLNLNSVQSALRSLLKKNYIEVSDIVYSGKVLTRRYIPVVSSEDYASENINGVLEDLLSSNILLQYVESENDIKVIERLQEKLEERKKILERKSYMTPANYGSVFSCCRSCHDPYAFALEFSFCSKC